MAVALVELPDGVSSVIVMPNILARLPCLGVACIMWTLWPHVPKNNGDDNAPKAHSYHFPNIHSDFPPDYLSGAS